MDEDLTEREMMVLVGIAHSFHINFSFIYGMRVEFLEEFLGPLKPYLEVDGEKYYEGILDNRKRDERDYVSNSKFGKDKQKI